MILEFFNSERFNFHLIHFLITLSLKDHLLECELEMITCSYKECTEVMERKNTFIHMEGECSYRKIGCRHCSISYLYLQELVCFLFFFFHIFIFF